MPDYQRIVSYLYEYSHGIKGANVGFAKIEKRQKQLKLYFHVKTNDKAYEYKIYFYRFRQGTMEGILLDTIKRNDTIIEFKSMYPLVIDLDQADGFLIYHSDNHFFGSEWKDQPIIIRSFKPLEIPLSIPEEELAEPPVSVPEEESMESSVPVLEEEAIESPVSILEEEPTESPVPISEEDLTESPVSILEEEPTESPVPISEEDLTESPVSIPEEKTASKLVEYIEALQLEKEAKEQGSSKESLDFDWKEYPSLPLPATYCLSPSIKIQLKDLDKIPNLPENVKTNGFLLLNYGNYGHLCLSWNSKMKQRYLGVPGVFDNEKSFISKLFGFEEFITVPVQSHKTGNFGYFILPV